MLKFFGENPQTTQGYFGVSYSSIRDIFYPTMEEAAHLMGFTVIIKAGVKEVEVYRNGFFYGLIKCRSMDNPNTIVGFKISRAMVDEIDTLPLDKAKSAWIKIIARLRLIIDGVENVINVTTTPEGFLFVYNKFKDQPTESYSMVQCSSYENEKYLPDDYIPSLLETYSTELGQAYIDGQFVNLTSGSVYRGYDRKNCDSEETVEGEEALYIGQDFNVNRMATVIHVKRKNVYHAVDEIHKGVDTPSVIKTLEERYPKNPKIVYPDSTGKNNTTKGVGLTDISLFKKAKFFVRAKNKNPRIRDRVNSVNGAFTKGIYRVNSKKCPEYVKCLEQQVYDANGMPDKSSGVDDLPDAGGYFVHYEMPINKPSIGEKRIKGLT